MADEKSNELPESPQTLTDDQIVTERTLRRRSFLTAAGALVAGGAVAIALGGRADAMAQATDPDQKKHERSDPDQKKHMRHDPDQKKHMRHDPDQKKHMRHDPDQKKHMRHDPDQKRQPPGDPGH